MPTVTYIPRVMGGTIIFTAPSPTLSTSPTTLSFAASQGGTSPASQNDTLSETAGVGTNWTSSISYGAGSGWLGVSPTSGSLAASGHVTIAFTCTTGALIAGTYTATVTFTATTGGATATVNVTFAIGAPAPPLAITIAGTQIVFDEDTFKLQLKLDERWRCQFTVLDYTGTQEFSYRQQVVVTDSVLGILFTGFVADVKKDISNMYPSGGIEHQIDCYDNRAKADKITSNFLYANQYAGTIAVHQWQKYLAAEGVLAAAAIRWDEALTDWQAGTLTGTTATTNAMDANPGDGDLELSLAGSPVTKAESTTANFNTGTLSNTQSLASNGGLTLTQHTATQLSATCLGYNQAGGSYTNFGIWNGSYSIVSGDSLQYTLWISSTSPGQFASVDGVCSDGTIIGTFAPSFAHQVRDQNGMWSSPAQDLSGFANNQWYSRTIDLTLLNGKTLNVLSLSFAGTALGNYNAYFYGIIIKNGGTTKLAVSPANAAGTNFVQATSLVQKGYSGTQASSVTAYDSSGYRISAATSLTGVGVIGPSVVSWQQTIPTSTLAGASCNVTIYSGQDGATWQGATENAAIPSLLVGASASGQSLYFKEVLSIVGPDPTIAPILRSISATVSPTYAATKNDAERTVSTQAGWNNGVLTNLTAQADNSVTLLNANSRTWDDASVANQTVFGSGATKTQATVNRNLTLFASTGADCRARFDFATIYNVLDMVISVQVPNANENVGIEFGTTNWGNGLNSYAYVAYLTTTQFKLVRGANNGAVGGSEVQLNAATFATALNVGDWHTIRVKWVAATPAITCYLDGVQYLTSADGTYSASASVAARFYNNSGATDQGYFDNFYIVQTLTSCSYLAQNLSLNTVATVDNSLMYWGLSQPNGSSIVAETSIDGGTTWTTATNGGQIPLLTNGASVTGKNLKVRFTFNSTDPSIQPVLYAYSVWISGQYSASGTRVSPSLSLAAVGRAATALVNWNANLPTGPTGATSLTVKTSIDGGATYQTVAAAGNAIPNINLQPLPYVDSFSANSSASYTQTNLTGGGAATWTWDSANSRLLATQTTSNDGVLIYTAAALADSNVQGDFNYSDSGGLVARYVDASDCYFLSIKDSLSASNPNTVRLFKIVAGTETQIGATIAISFVRGILHRFVLDVQGTTIAASMDGAQLLSVTDAGVSAAGNTGILAGHANGHKIQCYNFRSQPYGDNVSAKSLLTKVILTSTDPTVTPQLLDMQAMVASAAIGAGVLMASANYQYTFVDKNLDDAGKQSNYGWFIDQLKFLNFQARQGVPSPWVLSSNTLMQPSDLEIDKNLLVETAVDLYRNRQTLKNVIGSITTSDPFVGDGTKTSFSLRYPVALGTIPTITLDGQIQTVGLSGTSGNQWYYTIGSVTIAEDSSGTKLQNLDTLTVAYTGTYKTALTINNTAAQTALAIVEGGTGIVEAVEDVSSESMTMAAATTYANQLLARYCIVNSATNLPLGRTFTYKTLRNGLAIGQILSTNVPELKLINAALLITALEITVRTQPGSTIVYDYLATVSEIANVGSWQKLLASGLV